MEDRSLMLEVLGDTTELRIIDFLVINTPTTIIKNEIIKRTGISRASFYKVWKKLEKFGIVRPVANVGKIILYDLNKENSFVKFLIKVNWSLIEKSLEDLEKERKIAIRIH